MIAFRNFNSPATKVTPTAKDDCMMLIRDVVEHLSRCCDDCRHADDATAQNLLVSMRRDVHEIQRLCDRIDAAPPAASDPLTMAG